MGTLNTMNMYDKSLQFCTASVNETFEDTVRKVVVINAEMSQLMEWSEVIRGQPYDPIILTIFFDTGEE